MVVATNPVQAGKEDLGVNFDKTKYHIPAEEIDKMIEYFGLDQDD